MSELAALIASLRQPARARKDAERQSYSHLSPKRLCAKSEVSVPDSVADCARELRYSDSTETLVNPPTAAPSQLISTIVAPLIVMSGSSFGRGADGRYFLHHRDPDSNGRVLSDFRRYHYRETDPTSQSILQSLRNDLESRLPPGASYNTLEDIIHSRTRWFLQVRLPPKDFFYSHLP